MSAHNPEADLAIGDRDALKNTTRRSHVTPRTVGVPRATTGLPSCRIQTRVAHAACGSSTTDAADRRASCTPHEHFANPNENATNTVTSHFLGQFVATATLAAEWSNRRLA